MDNLPPSGSIFKGFALFAALMFIVSLLTALGLDLFFSYFVIGHWQPVWLWLDLICFAIVGVGWFIAESAKRGSGWRYNLVLVLFTLAGWYLILLLAFVGLVFIGKLWKEGIWFWLTAAAVSIVIICLYHRPLS